MPFDRVSKKRQDVERLKRESRTNCDLEPVEDPDIDKPKWMSKSGNSKPKPKPKHTKKIKDD